MRLKPDPDKEMRPSVMIPKDTVVPVFITEAEGGQQVIKKTGKTADIYKLKAKVLSDEFGDKVIKDSLWCMIERSDGGCEQHGGVAKYAAFVSLTFPDLCNEDDVFIPDSDEGVKNFAEGFVGKALMAKVGTKSFKNDKGETINFNTINEYTEMTNDQTEAVADKLNVLQAVAAATGGAGAFGADDEDLPY
jgi:hypothetical protein